MTGVVRLLGHQSVGKWASLSIAAAVFALNPVFSRADAYDPPANYYSTALGTGNTLKANLYAITLGGFVYHTYGDSRYNTLSQMWQDPNPNNSANLLTIYNSASVSSAWDNGVTWNREHIVPEYTLGIKVSDSYKGYGSDEFELAPAVPSINESRGNNGYGFTGSAVPAAGYGNLTGTDGNTYWYAGTQFRGDAARTAFYMATRYGYGQGLGSLTTGVDKTATNGSNSFNITLANGQLNNKGQFGDLNTLLHWAYEDPVDTMERKKNELVYTGLSYNGADESQHNRNPYIDHPEYIWAVFGTGPNTSQIAIGTPAADGSSNTTVNLGRVITGTNFSTSTVTVGKTGVTPTTFNVTAAGSGTSSLTGTGETFTYNPSSKSMVVGLTSSTAGVNTGTVTIHNSDLTTNGVGQGSADGDDVVNVTGTAVDHSNASFSSTSAVKQLTLNFGSVQQGSGTDQLGFSIANLLSASGYTAGLNLNAIAISGDMSALSTNLGTFTSETAGSSLSYDANLNTANAGTFTAEYDLSVSDESIPGATSGQPLVLVVDGNVVTSPEPGSLLLLTFGGGYLLTSRRRQQVSEAS